MMANRGVRWCVISFGVYLEEDPRGAEVTVADRVEEEGVAVGMLAIRE